MKNVIMSLVTIVLKLLTVVTLLVEVVTIVLTSLKRLVSNPVVPLLTRWTFKLHSI